MFSRRKAPKTEESASDVKKAYKSRIEHFIENVTDRNSTPIDGPGDLLERLFRWSQKEHDDKVYFHREYRAQSQARQTAEEERDNLSGILSQQQDQIYSLQEQIRSLERSHSGELARMNGEMERLNRTHKKTINEMDETFKSKITEKDKNHDSEQLRLKGQLLHNVEDGKAWSDGLLVLKFKELEILVGNLTAPKYVNLNLSELRSTPLHFDQGQLLLRVPKGKTHVAIKNIIWSILCRHFFGLPFGFGVIGPNPQHNALVEALRSWRMMVEDTQVPAFETAQSISTSCINHTGNLWRSATFESAFHLIMCDETAEVANATARRSMANFEAAASSIAEVFDTLAPYSKSRSQPSPTEIRKAVHLTREIAFQFGANREHLRLLIPRSGEQVHIGRNYHDYKDAAAGAGALVTVDMVTVPGLEKVAYDKDGQVSSRLTMEPCKIYSGEDL